MPFNSCNDNIFNITSPFYNELLKDVAIAKRLNMTQTAAQQ